MFYRWFSSYGMHFCVIHIYFSYIYENRIMGLCHHHHTIALWVSVFRWVFHERKISRSLHCAGLSTFENCLAWETPRIVFVPSNCAVSTEKRRRKNWDLKNGGRGVKSGFRPPDMPTTFSCECHPEVPPGIQLSCGCTWSKHLKSRFKKFSQDK